MQATKALKTIIQNNLRSNILSMELKGKGMCNYVWLVETTDKLKFMVKQEREDKETVEENDLLIEAQIIKTLNIKNPALKVPKIIFICESPKIYCYQYVPGRPMKEVWKDLSQAEKGVLCKDIGSFHAYLHSSLSSNESKQMGLNIDKSVKLDNEYENRVKNFLLDKNTPDKYRTFITKARESFINSKDKPYFGLCHYDCHDENIIIDEGRLACVIDFGDTGYHELCLDFNYHVQNYPDYCDLILNNYEKLSRNRISRNRLIAQTVFRAIKSIKNDDPKTKRKVYSDYMNWLDRFIPTINL